MSSRPNGLPAGNGPPAWDPQGARDLCAAIILKAIEDAKKVRDGRVMTFEKGTGLSGEQANRAFAKMEGRLRPWDDIEIFFASQHFENLVTWLDQDPDRVRAALHAQGLIGISHEHAPQETPELQPEVIYPDGVKTPQNGSTRVIHRKEVNRAASRG